MDLEKLLPKNKGKGSLNENKMDLTYKDGCSYFIPAPSESKINRIWKWEQAFRVNATIYSQTNPLMAAKFPLMAAKFPLMAAKIWQYVYTINTTIYISAYMWENLYHYDVTFCQLMDQYPNHSWSQIYNQMWNLAMRDLFNKFLIRLDYMPEGWEHRVAMFILCISN